MAGSSGNNATTTPTLPSSMATNTSGGYTPALPPSMSRDQIVGQYAADRMNRLANRDATIAARRANRNAGGAAAGAQPAGPNIFDNASTALQGAQDTMTGLTNYTPQTLAGTDLAPYQNPFTQQVIDTSMNALDRSRMMALNDVGANATGVGAFGGARHGVAEAETNRAFMDRAAQMAATLNMQGYNQAVDGAQFDIANNMRGAGMQMNAAQGLGNLANLGFGMGMGVNQMQAQAGAMQQAQQQALIDAARAQWMAYANQPATSLSYPLAAIGAAPVPQSQTQSQRPGLFNYLALAATAAGGA